jgi:hypothetical protein
MQCEKIYLPVLKAGEKMSKSEVYRILNLQSSKKKRNYRAKMQDYIFINRLIVSS